MSDLSRKVKAQRNTSVRGYAAVGLSSGFSAALATLVVQSFLAPPPVKVATVNVMEVMQGEIQRMQGSGMDPSEAEAYANIWGRQLDRSVENLANEFGVVLIASDAVAAGAPDMTELLKERLNHEIESFQQ